LIKRIFFVDDKYYTIRIELKQKDKLSNYLLPETSIKIKKKKGSKNGTAKTLG